MSIARMFAFLCVVLVPCTVSSDGDEVSDEKNVAGRIKLRKPLSHKNQESTDDTARPSPNQAAFRQVVPLNSNTFVGNVIKSRYVNHWVVLFCVPWFAHCVKVKQDFDELALQVQGSRNGPFSMLSNEVRFAEVDCSTNKPLCNAMDIQTYPVVVHYHGGGQSQWSSGMRVNNSTMLLPKWVDMRLESSSNPACAAPEPIGVCTVLELVGKVALVGLALVCFFVFSMTGIVGHARPVKLQAAAAKGIHGDCAQSYSSSFFCPASVIVTPKDLSPPVMTRPRAPDPRMIDLDALMAPPPAGDALHSLPVAPMSLEL